MRRSDTLITLLAALVVLSGGLVAGYRFTDGFQAFTLESARRLQAMNSPRLLGELPLELAEGEKRTLADWQGRYVLVDFIFTRCTTLCTAMGSGYARLQHVLASEIESDRVRLLTVSIDPRRDRLTDLAEYRLRYTKDISGWDIGRPKDEQVLAAWLTSFGVVAIPEPLTGIAHNAAIHVVAPNGRLVAIYDLGDFDSAAGYVRSKLDNPA
ncbi:MAG: SCO family protein [Betaproteobacteria bacterium]|nr:MAG: SCO family protein [Betaproteobacteria bacterium]